MALLSRAQDLRPPSPSLTNPDLILPYRFPDDPADYSSASVPRSVAPTMAQSAFETMQQNASWTPHSQHQVQGMNQRPSIPGAWMSEESIMNGVAGSTDPVTMAPPVMKKKVPVGFMATIDPKLRAGLSIEAPEYSPSVYSPTDSELVVQSPQSPTDFSPQSPTFDKPDPQQDRVRAILDEDENDPFSHTALSLRAEEILANAKKRLTAMESNLTRARSISIQRSASVASTVDDRQRSPRSPNLKGNSWAISAAKLRQSNFGNHSRVLSETSVRPTFNKKNDRDQIRIASAMGSSVLSRTGIDSPDYSDDHSPVYRGGARILEPLREDELMGDTSSRGSPSYEKGSRTASALSKPRSSIQLSELRDQVQDLKGKITSLKNRTRRESMQRRSLQMLKSPSPFTDAESWSSPGPYMQHSPSPSHSLERSDETRSTPTINKTKGSPKVLDPTPEIEPEEEKVDDDVMVDDYYDSQSRTQSRLDTGLAIMEEEPIPEENPLSQHQYAEKTTWSPHSQVAEILNADEEFGDSIISSTNSTSSFDLESSELIDEPELPPLQSHEDRPDAFDYEHFVLNSAMGSFSRQGKRPSRSHSPSSSSDCSASTTSTTRPFYNTGDNFDMSTDSLPYSSPNGSPTFKSLRPENVRMHSEDGYGDNKRPNHSRQTSTDSVSTVATFATAISGNDPSSRNQSRAQSRTQSRQAGATKNGYLAPSRPVVPITSFSRPRPPSVLFPSLSEGSINKEPVQPSVKARNGILSLLLSVDGEREGQDDNVLRSLLPEDKALLRSVVEELQSAVGRLMGRGEGSDGARSMLEGVRRELSSGGHGDVHGL